MKYQVTRALCRFASGFNFAIQFNEASGECNNIDEFRKSLKVHLEKLMCIDILSILLTYEERDNE